MPSYSVSNGKHILAIGMPGNHLQCSLSVYLGVRSDIVKLYDWISGRRAATARVYFLTMHTNIESGRADRLSRQGRSVMSRIEANFQAGPRSQSDDCTPTCHFSYVFVVNKPTSLAVSTALN
jgi:hypothetical protein